MSRTNRNRPSSIFRSPRTLNECKQAARFVCQLEEYNMGAVRPRDIKLAKKPKISAWDDLVPSIPNRDWKVW